MEMPNVIPIAGNHEQMMLECMSVLIKEVKDENSVKEFAEKFSDNMFQKLYAWQRNGGIATTDELSKLDNETRKDVLDYVADFSWYEKVAVNGQKYLLVHGGLGNFDIKRDIDDYSLDELVWSRVDYDVRYFDDVITVTGHTPTRYIEDNPRPGYVYRKNNHMILTVAHICRVEGLQQYVWTQEKNFIPVLMVDTDTDSYYRITDGGCWPLMEYGE